MRFTRRRGGPMATLHVSHDLRPRDLAVILARHGDRMRGGDPRPDPHAGGVTPESGGQPGPAAVGELAREIIREHGTSAYLSEAAWDEDLYEGEAALLATWAVAQVHRLYPEAAAADTELASFAHAHAWTPETGDDEDTPDADEGTLRIDQGELGHCGVATLLDIPKRN